MIDLPGTVVQLVLEVFDIFGLWKQIINNVNQSRTFVVGINYSSDFSHFRWKIYLPHLTLGSPLNPEAQAQNGFPVPSTTLHIALVPLHVNSSQGSGPG